MNKLDFLSELNIKLSGLPEEDIEESLDYYSEIIDDRMEDGLSEKEAVAAVGDPAEIAAQILTEIPLGRLVKAKLKPRHTIRAWEIILLILGAPVWLPLLAAAAIIVLSIYIVIWSIVVSLYAVDLSLAVTAVACVPAVVIYAVGGNAAACAFMLGGALILAGLALLMFLGCNQTAKGALWLGKMILRGIKSCFIRREAAK